MLHHRMDHIQDLDIPVFISCDKCKCLIKEFDAIQGESRIVPINSLSFWGRSCLDEKHWPESRGAATEQIEKVYFCHRCVPKKKK